MTQRGGIFQRFGRGRKAGTATEFAICGLALFLTFMVIVNLGMLGLSLGALEHAVEAAARKEAVAASATSTSGGTFTCPAASAVQSAFNVFASPPLPASTTVSGANAGPLLTVTWSDSNASIPGAYLTLTVQYTFMPIGFGMLQHGLTITLSTVALVSGSGVSGASFSSSCATSSTV